MLICRKLRTLNHRVKMGGFVVFAFRLWDIPVCSDDVPADIRHSLHFLLESHHASRLFQHRHSPLLHDSRLRYSGTSKP